MSSGWGGGGATCMVARQKLFIHDHVLNSGNRCVESTVEITKLPPLVYLRTSAKTGCMQ